MPNQTTIRSLGNTDADLRLACDLFHQVFGQKNDVDAWRWKYQQGPRLGAINTVAYASEGKKLLGHVGASAFTGYLEGQKIAMVQVADVMVHPDARSGHHSANLYRRLMSAMQAEVQTLLTDLPCFIYGFPGKRPSNLGQRVGLYRSLYFCAEHSLSITGNRPTGWSWRLRGHRVQQVQWSHAQEWLNVMDTRHRPLQSQPRILKTAAYLLWRYAANPHHRYQLWVHTHWGIPQTWWITRPDLPELIIDAAWPSLDNVNQQALAAFAATTRASTLVSWVVPAGLQTIGLATKTPINAVEIAGLSGWHPAQPEPQFHPGDTDVY